MLAAASNSGTWDLLRVAVLAETVLVGLLYLWAFADLLRTPAPKDKALKAMRIGRFCRVTAVLAILALAILSIVSRFDHSDIALGLLVWQIVLCLLAAAWALLDRTRYQELADVGSVPAAGRAIEALARRELEDEDGELP